MEKLSLARKAYNEIEKIEQYDDNGFSMVPIEEIEEILEKYDGDYNKCSCGSQYCEICNGSVDPSWTVVFPDGSRLHIGNPYEVVYSRFYIVKEVQ